MAERFLRDTYRILESTDPSEYVALSDADKALYQLIISAGKVNFADGTLVRSVLWGMFGEGSVTRAKYEDLLPASVVEEP